MQPDEDKVDDAVWAALFHARPQRSAWKGFDWSAMNRPHNKGMIQNPAGKPNRLSSPKRGVAESWRLFRELFAKTICCVPAPSRKGSLFASK
jgi:hypothetical protein